MAAAGAGEGIRAVVVVEAGRSREARTDELGVAASDGECGTCGDWGRGLDIAAMAESLCRRMRESLGLLCCEVGNSGRELCQSRFPDLARRAWLQGWSWGTIIIINHYNPLSSVESLYEVELKLSLRTRLARQTRA
jgi:hypothetical protein